MPGENDEKKKSNTTKPTAESDSFDRDDLVKRVSFFEENNLDTTSEDESLDDFERAYQQRIEGSSLLGQLKQRDAQIAWRPVVVVFIVCWLASLFYWKNHSSHTLSADWLTSEKNQILTDHEYWRLLTSIAVHSDLSHLLSNGVLFFIFGWILRAYVGSFAFPYLAILAGIITQTITLLTYPSGVRLIGASGAIYAMVGLWLTYWTIPRFSNRLRNSSAASSPKQGP